MPPTLNRLRGWEDVRIGRGVRGRRGQAIEQPVGRSLRARCGFGESVRLRLEMGEPRRDVGCMVGARCIGEAEPRATEGSAQFGDELFGGTDAQIGAVARYAVSIEAVLGTRCVRKLMKHGGVVRRRGGTRFGRAKPPW